METDVMFLIFRPVSLSLSAALVLIAFNGCKREPEVRKPAKIDVQVFLVTKAGLNVKLGLVNVAAAPYEAVAASLKPVLAERNAGLAELQAADEQRRRLLPQYATEFPKLEAAYSDVFLTESDLTFGLEAAKTRADAFVGNIQVQLPARSQRREALEASLHALRMIVAGGISAHSEREAQKITDEITEAMKRELWAELPEERKTVLTAAAKYLNAMKQLQRRREDFEKAGLDRIPKPEELASRKAKLGDPQQFLAAMPEPSFQSKTDADGRCTLLLPSGSRWVLSATAERDLALSGKETSHWIVELPLNATNGTEGPEMKIILSNDNCLQPFQSPLNLLVDPQFSAAEVSGN